MAIIDNFDLNTNIKIVRRVWTPDGLGGGSYTRTTQYNKYCRFWQAGSNEINQWDRNVNSVQYQVAMNPIDIHEDDLAIVAGTTFSITTPNNVCGEDEIMVITLSKPGVSS